MPGFSLVSSFALKVARKHKVIVITKTDKGETNTRYAQGGIASVTDEDDSFEKHATGRSVKQNRSLTWRRDAHRLQLLSNP